jgi:methylthioribose-1-phosphate isomerase
MRVQPIEWRDGVVAILDQTQLPQRMVVHEYDDWQGVAEAIRVMQVRGAPAIGIAAAYGLALAARTINAPTMEAFRAEFGEACRAFAQTRPTAVNLFGAIERMQAVVAHLAKRPTRRGRACLPKHTPSARKTTPPTTRWANTARHSCPQTPAY